MPDLNSLALPPLPEFALPPLPTIADENLARVVVTHASFLAGPKQTTSLETDIAETADNYEKLEHVGDAMLSTVATLLLQDMYPQLPAGSATMLKAHLVNNKTLAQLCVRYNIMDKFIASPSALYNARMQTRVQASVFEAYIAGVFYDFLASELPGMCGDAMQAMKGTAEHAALGPLPELRAMDQRTRGDAYSYLERWLRPLLTPVAEFALEFMRQSAKDMQGGGDDKMLDEPDNDGVTTGATGALNGWLQKHHGIQPTYTATPIGSRWHATCTCTFEGNTYTSEAVRDSKKAAWAVAAWKVCRQAGLEV